MSGIRAARKNKRELLKSAAASAAQGGNTTDDVTDSSVISSSQGVVQKNVDDGVLVFDGVPKNGRASSLAGSTSLPANESKNQSKKPNKNFFSRFVEGYLGVGNYYDEVRNERLTLAISEWFGRQKNGTATSASMPSDVDEKVDSIVESR